MVRSLACYFEEGLHLVRQRLITARSRGVRPHADEMVEMSKMLSSLFVNLDALHATMFLTAHALDAGANVELRAL